MAFHDWNMDGKKDWQDDFLEYNLFRETFEKEEKEDDLFDSDDDDFDDDSFDEE